MTTYLAMPDDEIERIVAAWTDHSWPIPAAEAARVAESLGWRPSSIDQLYTTATPVEEDGAAVLIEEGQASSVRAAVGRSTLGKDVPTTEPAAQFDRLLAAWTARWGQPARHTHRGVNSAKWLLANGMQVALLVTPRRVEVNMWSPELTVVMANADD